MRVAFYAPLKPVDHPTPSGDRRMARAFRSLLEASGHHVEIASSLRSLDRLGDPDRQKAIRDAATIEGSRLVSNWRTRIEPAPDIWFTYHSYYKAPDWLGPAVAAGLCIPYVVAEASVAGKRAGGAWDLGHRATVDGVNTAARVLAMTGVDAAGLVEWLGDPRKVVLFPPFLAQRMEPPKNPRSVRRDLSDMLALPLEPVWLVTVAMMRDDIKTRSYRLLAHSLAAMRNRDWRLLVIGDGDNADEVRALLTGAAGDRVRFLGRVESEAVARVLSVADVFVWPALEEAYGMAILEALALGLPVVACDEGGVSDLVAHEVNGVLVKGRSARQLAAFMDRLVGDPKLRRHLAAGALARFEERHSPDVARARMTEVLAEASSIAQEPRCS